MIPASVQVGYLDNAWTASPVWVTLPAEDVERIAIRRGRPVRGKVADIGRATITLINRIGDYDPQGERGRYFSAGYAFYSHPGKRVRVRTVETTPKTIFDGVISSVRHIIDDHPERIVYECVDRMQLLRLREYDYTATTGTEQSAFNDAVAPLSAPSFFATVGVSWRSVSLPAERCSVYDRVAKMPDVTGAAFYVSRDGVVTYRSFEHRYQTPVATLTNDPLTDVWIVGQSRLGLSTWLSATNPRTLGGRARYDEISDIILDAADVVNVVRTRKPPGAWNEYVDVGSIGLYDVRSRSIESDVFVNNAEAQSYGQYIRAEYAHPTPTPDRITIRRPTTILELAQIDLFDVVLVEFTARLAYLPNRVRYDRTRRIYCLVSSLEYILSGEEAQLVIGTEPTRGLTPLLAGAAAPEGTIGGKAFV